MAADNGDVQITKQKTTVTSLNIMKCCFVFLLVTLGINMLCLKWTAISKVDMPTLITRSIEKGVNQTDNRTSERTRTMESNNSGTNNGIFYIEPMIMKNVGLGNKMMVYASVVGLAHTLNMTLVIQHNYPLRNIFKLEAKVLHDATLFTTFKTITSEFCCKYVEMFVKLPRNSNYIINNLLQSWKYFKDVKSNVRHQFAFKDLIKSAAEKRILNIYQKYKSQFSGEITLIAVHIRMGDKSTKDARKTGNFVATPGYIKKAMAYFVSNFLNCVFVICSDSKEWVRKHVNFDFSMEMISETNSPEVDMAILSLCNHTIMTVGTFGWWGAYLAGGTVVYYGNPYDEKDKLWSKIYNKTDYFPPEWIPML